LPIVVEAPISGHVLRTFYAAGDEVGEHEVLAVLGEPGEQMPPEGPPPGRRRTPTTWAQRHRRTPRIDLTSLVGTGPMGRIIIADVAQDRATAAAPPTPQPVPTPPTIKLIKIPMVVRISIGAKYGAQHSQDWSSMWRAC
jgi:pyruvate/2-oxoglutarate dehydrogenase complex dihydrolipoamide acyltransferase (E2) component